MANNNLKLAVMIDADNASPKIVSKLFEEIASIGEAAVRRVYGDFSSPNMNSWVKTAKEHAIRLQMAVANTKGKNASDIEMVIDAMELMHSERFDGFCLVTSDSDFTALALKLRERGLIVYGFGEQKTPNSFIQACNRFIYTENLGELPVETDTATKTVTSKNPNAALPLIRQAINQIDSEDDWVALSQLGSQLSKLKNDFDTRTYGRAKLSDLLNAIEGIEIQKSANGRAEARLKK